MRAYVVVLLALISFSSYAQNAKPNYTLEDIWKTYSFYPRAVYGIRSMNDGENYTVLENNTIKKFKYKSGSLVNNVFSLSDIKTDLKFDVEEYSFSQDESMVLLSSDIEPIYRHSNKANYYLYNIKQKTLTELSRNGKQQLMQFSPDGKHLAFVRDNNLYVMSLSDLKEVAITNDGEKNAIINGAPDWVYEEEFSFAQAYEWAPDGQSIAYLRFDESKVKEYTMPIYEGLYPEMYSFKYPKAGEDNSKVTVHVYHLFSKSVTDIEIESDYEYIPRLVWTKSSEKLSIPVLNRLQNHLQILLANTQTGKTNVLYEEKNDTYIEIYDVLTFTDDGKNFIFCNEKTGYNHLYLYDINGQEVNAITQGNWEVVSFLGYNSKTKTVYYISTENSPTQRMLYSVGIDGTKKKCLNEKAGVNNVEFSAGYKYFINTWSSAATPTEVDLYKGSGELIRSLKDNNAMFDLLNKYNWSPKEFVSLKNDNGDDLNAWIIKPANFDPNKKYPVFMTVYGGPGNQTVMDQWEYTALWHNYLAQKGYIIFSVDNRGTDGRGYQFRRATYGKMGALEAEDQAAGAHYLQSLPYVDGQRIGIQGWSYGGYMSTLCLEKYPEIFKMAIAVAPVTNWRYYDSVYSERYLGLPDQNPQAYDANSPTNPELVKKMKGRYLLIHGSADDNVHLQNTMELSKLLIEADIDFQEMIYPNKNHGIYGGNTRLHLFRKMSQFIVNNL
ncbi:MAG: S9 family peptidase [Bacteroidales bacterium]|nr:S9 family peptidase [Bacteroidales bacterium]